jgi:hypothetical protein
MYINVCFLLQYVLEPILIFLVSYFFEGILFKLYKYSFIFNTSILVILANSFKPSRIFLFYFFKCIYLWFWGLNPEHWEFWANTLPLRYISSSRIYAHMQYGFICAAFQWTINCPNKLSLEIIWKSGQWDTKSTHIMLSSQHLYARTFIMKSICNLWSRDETESNKI